jgi:hypothetical protein
MFFKILIQTQQMEDFDQRTSQNIQNVRNVIKTMDAKNYDGEG